MNSKVMELISQITILGIEVSNTTQNDIWVSYSGHVDLLEVKCIYGGYNRSLSGLNQINCLLEIYLKRSLTRCEDELIEKLKDVIEKLDEMKKEPYIKVQ